MKAPRLHRTVALLLVGAGFFAGVNLVGPGRLAARQLPDTASVIDGATYVRSGDTRVSLRYRKRDSLAARAVLDFLQHQPPLLSLPDSLPSGVTVYLAHTRAAFDALTGGTVPEWSGGVALPGVSRVVIPPVEGRSPLDGEGRRVLRHEWAHLGLHQAVGGLRVPRWFDEGYAQWASGGWDVADAWRLRVLLAVGRAPPLDSLRLSWPRGRTDAEAAYLLSASAVEYLLQESGPRGLATFLARWRELRSFPRALRLTFGVTVGQFEEDWRRYAKDRYGWLFVVSHSALFWMILALVLLFMMWARRGRNRERMAHLRALETPEHGSGSPPDPEECRREGPDPPGPGYPRQP